jgi:hypothetical protein
LKKEPGGSRTAQLCSYQRIVDEGMIITNYADVPSPVFQFQFRVYDLSSQGRISHDQRLQQYQQHGIDAHPPEKPCIIKGESDDDPPGNE